MQDTPSLAPLIVFFEHKTAGRLKSGIEPLEIEIGNIPLTVRDLITSLVEKTVSDFNNKIRSKPDEDYHDIHLKFQDDNEIKDLSDTGKIAFGLLYNDNKVDISEAITTATQGYEDGLFKICVNEVLLGNLDSKIDIKTGDLISVIRLAFLSGSLS